MAEWDFYSRQVAKRFAAYQEKHWRCSFIDHWEENAVKFPDKEAFADSKTRLSWMEVKTYSDRLALGLLELGLKRDEVIAVQLPFCAEFAIIRGAYGKAGVILLEIATTLRHGELRQMLKTSGAAGIIIPRIFRNFDYFQMVQEIKPDLDRLQYVFVIGDEVPEGAISIQKMLQNPLEEKYPPDYLAGKKFSKHEISTLQHTTGTTGQPKLVPFSLSLLEYVGYLHYRAIGGELGPSDTCAIICPAITGPNILLFYAASMVGARIVLMEQFRPEEALALLEKEKATITAVVPTLLAMMLNVPAWNSYDLSSLRFVICTGASLVYALAREAEEKFGCPIVQHYGSNKAGVVTVMQRPDWPRDTRILTVGKPPPEHELKIVDDAGGKLPRGEIGSIVVRGPGCTYGYYKDKEATLAAWTGDGWYNMGDLGKLDRSGNLSIVGRQKDMIIRGGQNIYPVEVESILLTHPKVLHVALVRMPDAIMGEKACAYVVPRPGQEFTFDEMTSFIAQKKIAPFKIPERLEIVDSMPMSGEQKISKKDLEQDIGKKLEAEGRHIEIQ
ncbi:MAG: AMP-binding protein [Desulfobacterales bacterium]|nr:AMP-binding protein [Desulfobacterales bacterium]